jgi:hypothetical protein
MRITVNICLSCDYTDLLFSVLAYLASASTHRRSGPLRVIMQRRHRNRGSRDQHIPNSRAVAASSSAGASSWLPLAQPSS